MKKTTKQKLRKLIANEAFTNFYCYKEDKWLQNTNWENKLKAVFGGIEKAIKEYEEQKEDYCF